MTMCKCCKMSKMEGELTNKVVWKNNLQKITQDESLNKSCTERQFVESLTPSFAMYAEEDPRKNTFMLSHTRRWHRQKP